MAPRRPSDASVLLLFVDGLGLAPRGPDNPLARHPTPSLEAVLGGPLTLESSGQAADRLLLPIDAGLGVEGLPQSATGQTTLFTGINAARLLGRHVTAFPGRRLQELLLRHSLLLRLRRAGCRVTFANAFSERYFELVAERRLRRSASVWATLAASLELRREAELRAGRAVVWDVTGSAFAGDEELEITAREAGGRLARLAREHHFVLYETFLTDLVGHRRTDVSPEEVVDRLDGLLGGVLAECSPSTTVVLTSDHGNFEDSSHRQHTRNPVPLLVIGSAWQRYADVVSIADVAACIEDTLVAR